LEEDAAVTRSNDGILPENLLSVVHEATDFLGFGKKDKTPIDS
jgi:hypothetical protein